ncbi:unnamed protein product [Phytomonas sp. Hart1]|nr:unnamed protein product [Phytomonas sp. Hart1]|eukprot:CCW69352.1 unnamed protein product [Phytomonas sp. isolate Hart1]
MSLAQSQISSVSDSAPSLPRPSSILQKQSSFSRESKKAVTPSETINSLKVTSAGFNDSNPAQVTSVIHSRGNLPIESRSKLSASVMTGQDAETAKKLSHPHSASVPHKPIPMPTLARNSLPVPLQSSELTSVPARVTTRVPLRVSGSSPSPPLPLSKVTSEAQTRRKQSPPRALPQRVVTEDSTARRQSKDVKSQDMEGVRRVSDGTTPSAVGAPSLAYPSLGNNCISGNNSFGPSGFGSFCYGMGSMGPMGYQNPFSGESMYGLMGSAYSSMGPGRLSGMGSFMYRGMDVGMPGCVQNLYPSAYGSFRYSNLSMDPMRSCSFIGNLNGSFYGSRGIGSILNTSLYDNPYMENSFYKISNSNKGSDYGLAAQWSSLSDISNVNDKSDPLTSSHNRFQQGSNLQPEDFYPKSEQDTCVLIKRSGRRGGKSLSTSTNNDKLINTEIKIKRAPVNENKKAGTSSIEQSPGVSIASTRPNEDSHKHRAAVPTSYDIHTLLIVDKVAGGKPDIVVRDPNTVVLKKNNRSETFECDEALQRTNRLGEVDSVLFSDLRSNWLAGHCSAILVCAGKGKDKDAVLIAHNMVKKCLERLEKAPVTSFDVTITMCQLRGANQGLDLLNGSTSYGSLKLGSHPVYGPCLLELTTKVVKNAKDCVDTLNKGIAQAQRTDEMIVAFLVLKTIRKSSSGTEVFLSSLCIAYNHEESHHITDLKDKSSISPHRLFRYAVGGTCVCVSMVVLNEIDSNALACLEAQRKVREVKNKPPRSGNVRRFIEFTDKEILRQKEKLLSSPEMELKQREMQIKRMEDMLEDARAILNDPEHTQMKGYILY